MLYSIIYFTNKKRYGKSVIEQLDVDINILDETILGIGSKYILFVVNNPQRINFVNDKDEVIYCISCNNEFCKIGTTTNFLSRYNTLQTANPYKLGVEFVVKVGRGNGKSIEQSIHRYLQDKRKIREWFDMEILNDEYLKNKINRIQNGRSIIV